jgi:hypothetical protein
MQQQQNQRRMKQPCHLTLTQQRRATAAAMQQKLMMCLLLIWQMQGMAWATSAAATAAGVWEQRGLRKPSTWGWSSQVG